MYLCVTHKHIWESEWDILTYECVSLPLPFRPQNIFMLMRYITHTPIHAYMQILLVYTAKEIEKHHVYMCHIWEIKRAAFVFVDLFLFHCCRCCRWFFWIESFFYFMFFICERGKFFVWNWMKKSYKKRKEIFLYMCLCVCVGLTFIIRINLWNFSRYLRNVFMKNYF